MTIIIYEYQLGAYLPSIRKYLATFALQKSSFLVVSETYKNNNWKLYISLHFLYIWADRLEWINKLTGNSFQINPPCHLLRTLQCVVIKVKKDRISVLWLCVFLLHDITHIHDTGSYKKGKCQIKIQILNWIWLFEAKVYI